MTDEAFDALLRRVDRAAAPDAAFADRLFDVLAVEAGLRPSGGRRATLGRWFPFPAATARRLSWAAVLVALLVAILGLLVVGQGGQRLPTTLPPPAAVPSPTLHVGSSLLSIGSRPPTWTGKLLDGQPFSTDQLRGRPAAILTWCTCIRGPELQLFVEAARGRSDIGFVFVSLDPEGTTRGVVDDLSIDLPVVLDPQMELVTAWKLAGYPELVLLRADGTLADIQKVTFTGAKLDQLLGALAANGPIPEPDSHAGQPTDAQGRMVLSTVLEPGSPAPELSGPRLGGGTVSTRDFLGRPLLVQFWLPPNERGVAQGDEPSPAALLDEIDRRGGSVRLLLVVEIEPEPGDAQRYLAGRASPPSVMFDLTGEQFTHWGLAMDESTVLLDADGQPVRLAGPEALANPAGFLDGVGPSPSAP